MRLLPKHMRPFVFLFSVFFLLGTFLLIDGPGMFALDSVSAQGDDVLGVETFGETTALSGGGEGGIIGIVARIINIFLGLLGVIAVGLMIYAGVVWMSSAGDETKIATAKKILVNATIGLAIIMSSWAIASFILNKLGVASGVLEEEVGFGDGSDGGTFDCLGFCVSPGNERERCTEDIFVVKSLSPNTDNTGMHNTVVRAVFSDKVKTADKNRLVSLVAKTDTVGMASVFDGSLPASVNNILTTVAAQAGGWAQWASYGNGFTIQNNGEKSISRVDDDTFGIVTEFQLTAQADGGGALQKKEIRGMEIGKLYELKMVYKVETAGSFEVRFADFDQNSAYTDPQSNSPVIAGGLTNTSGVWRVHSQRFLWQPTTRGENSLANDGAIIFSVKNSPNIAFKGQVASLGVYPVFEPGTTVPPSRVELSEDNHVVSAYYDALENVCTTNTTDSCLGIGDYEIVVPEDLESVQGRPLQVRSDIPGCEDLAFPRVAGFAIADNSSVDLQDPTISPITFKKDGADVPAHLLLENNAYTVHAEFADRSAAQGGIGLVTYTISGEGMQARTVQDGMSVADGSDGPYMVSSTLLFGALRGGDPDQYTITVSGFDIDNNPTSTEHVFNVQGASCNNGVLDEGEIFVDEGGVCASNGACLINADCLSGLCVEGECKADKPMIVDVYPQAWAGAPGNVITVAGSGFGEEPGRVVFSYTDGAGNPANLIATEACAGFPSADLWTDEAAVVTVPIGLPQNSLSSIRIERADYDANEDEHNYKFDTSTDTHGPSRGNTNALGGSGYFLQNGEQSPGLCAITTLADQNNVIEEALINTQVVALGENFGNNIGTLNFGAVPGAVTNWSNNKIQSRVPNMPRQQVYVFAASSDNKQSNALPLHIITEEIEDAPEITSVEGLPTSNNSLITIRGRHFGTSGRVFLGSGAAIDSCLTGNTDDCIELKVEGIEGCNSVATWSDKQIIAEIQDIRDDGTVVPTANYVIGVLRTSQGRQGSNTDKVIDVTNEGPKPSLCGVSPSSGPAPNGNIMLSGKNLDEEHTIYYFKKDANTDVEGARNHIDNGDFGDEEIFWNANGDASLSRDAVTETLNIQHVAGNNDFTLIQNDDITGLEAGATYRLSFTVGGLNVPTVQARFAEQDIVVTSEAGVFSGTVTLPVGQIEGKVSFAISDFNNGSFTLDDIRFTKETGLETWLSSAIHKFNGVPVTKEVNNQHTEILTQIPEDENQYSMITGPIRVLSQDGSLSNGVTYAVENCLDDDAEVPDGMICCLEGEDAGMLRPANALCAGEVREAGYVWRFNTGLIPVIPRVLEQCNDSVIARVERAGGDEEPPARLTPSPSPSGLLTRDQLACPNANVTVVFNTPMSNIDQNDVTIVACGQGEDPLCDENGIGLVGFNYNSGQNLLNITRGGLAQDTWYEVRLDTTKIKSPDGILLRSGGEEGCPDNTYCFRFKTQGDACELTGAFVSPSTYTTKHFGVIQDPSRPRDETHIFNPEHPYIFTVLGLTEKACLTIDVRDRNWQWGSYNVAIADPTQQPERKDQAIVKAIQPTSRVDIFSRLIEPPIESEPLRLTISPEDPRVVDYWPNCTKACSNGVIGVVFNRRMLDLRLNNVVVEKCNNSVCESTGPGNLPVSLVGDLGREEIEFRVRPDDVLEHGAYYKVTIQGAQPVAGYRGDGNDPEAGTAMPDFSWVFRVRGENAEEAFCTPDSISVIPQDYTAREVGERNVYTALPLSAPDECSREGQELDPFGYGWEWDSGAEVDGIVAEITTFSSPVSENRSCNNQCLKTGSDVLRQEPVFTALCGNGEIDPGEDCDIDIIGEVPGISCGYDCLRPGNTQGSCGNGEVDSELGEECDNDSAYCSDTCLNTGTEPLPAVMEAGRSYCGSGDVGPGEDCDGGEGCSSSCLNTGTLLSNIWCFGQGIKPDECSRAVTVCGNDRVEHNEECDDINDVSCTDQCVYGDLSGLADPNDNEYYQDPVTEGATRFATRAGSSLLYSIPSFCGDSDEGIGEDPACEAAAGEPLGQNPTQLATAIGEGQMNEDNEMSTEITANAATYVDGEGNAQALDISGLGTYTLQCGYAEGDSVSMTEGFVIDTITNCPNNTNNERGVGSSTCCVERPSISETYPAVEGVGGICRNTALSVKFEEAIDEQTIQKSAFRLIKAEANDDGVCPEETENVTEQAQILALSTPPVLEQGQRGFFGRIWHGVTSFIRGIFFDDVIAFNPTLTWCTTSIELNPTVQYTLVGEEVHTIIHLGLSALLDEGSNYAVIVSGGSGGIKNNQGVGIRSREVRDQKYLSSDVFSFTTGDEICKVDSVSVDPADYTYNTPDTPNDFSINVKTSTEDSIGDQQEISPIDNVYDWTYRWGPRTSQIYTIPQDLSYDGLVGTVSSTAVEGSELLVGSIDITVDVSDDSTVGDTFSGVSELTSFFCENPWPSRDDMPYNNEVYNFSFYYCADAGLSGERVDDLPFLVTTTVAIVDVLAGPPIEAQKPLYKKIFPSDKNEDAIGVQVFQNPNASTTRQWLDFYFPGTVDNMQPVSISGYGGFTNGHTYYVAARNMTHADNLYNNIYSFTINRDAQENTKQVFTQIIDTLELNSNLSNFNLCLAEGVVYEEGSMFALSQDLNTHITDIGCSTDFECRDAYGNPLAQTNGVCFSARDKMARDIDRLASLKNLENSIERYKSERGQYPQIVGGTFVAQYTNSRWPSWNILSQMIGGAQIDPINAWTQCSRCNGGLIYADNPAGQIAPTYDNLCELRVACGENDSAVLCQSTINNGGNPTFGEENSELFSAVFSCAMHANSCEDAARCYEVDPVVNTRCGLRNYESGEFLCAENEQGFLEWRKIESQACAQATECALGLDCADNICAPNNTLLADLSPCQTNDQCKTGHCATLLGGGEGLCVNRGQCIKTNGAGLVPINSDESADGQFMCDNGELIIDQNNNRISDAKEKDYQGAAACQSDIQCPGALNSCEDLDQQTCWDAANTTVHCPALSQM
ncbi:MAG: hypothetical protein HON29_03300, partial [Candidatus Magasanikbacteria bacterium]|nr:hypothetical protein [Candidatus Magasanikbacteria bacterium]